MKGKKFFARLYYYFKKNDKNAHIDESDALIGSIATLLLIFGVGTFLNSFYSGFFAKYLVIPDLVFFGISIFSLYFLIVMKLERGSRKSSLLMCTFPFIASLIFLFHILKLDLSEANNGLSLIALSLTLLFMPMDKFEEEHQIKMKEIEKNYYAKKEKAKDEFIESLEAHNKELLEVIGDLSAKQKGYADKMDEYINNLNQFEKNTDFTKQEVNNFKE